MAERRKSSKGRVLKEGESERKNGTFQFRYTDSDGKRKYCYAKTLNELREKEAEIQRDLLDGVSYSGGEITVLQLAERYLSQKQNLRPCSIHAYQTDVNLIKKYEFANFQIKKVKPSDVKDFFITLHNEGYSYSMIDNVRKLLKPAFQMAVEDDRIRKNPLNFTLTDIIKNDTVKREALTADEKASFLEFVRTGKYSKNYDRIVILAGTGMRVSEMCGLTLRDVDFQNNRIHINKQLLKQNAKYYVNEPKTASGTRYIPMTPEVRQAFQRVIANRKPLLIEQMIDGYGGFVFLNRNGNPIVSDDIGKFLMRITNSYNKEHSTKLNVTPHIFRHTFATVMAAAGMDLKSLQYLLGHGDASTTLNTYAHSHYETAKQAFERITAIS